MKEIAWRIFCSGIRHFSRGYKLSLKRKAVILTDDIKSAREAEELVRVYEKYRKNTLYEAVMDVIVRANYEKFKEVSSMCQALVEIMQPYIDEQVGLRVEKELKKIAEREMERAMELTRVLLAAGRMEDLNRAMDDKEYRSRLCEELALS